MNVHKNQQLDELMAGVRETLESLPDDGKEHRVEIQVGPHNSGNVAGGNQYIVKLGPEEPTRPEATRSCPQCHRGTWRGTRQCIHCSLDLFAHDQAVLRAGVRRRALGLMMVFVVLGFALLLGAQFLPRSLASWAGIAALGSLFMAAVAGKQAEGAK